MAWGTAQQELRPFAVTLFACGDQVRLASDASMPDAITIQPISRDASTSGEGSSASEGGIGDAVATTDAACGDASLIEASASCASFPCAKDQFCLTFERSLSGPEWYCQAIPDCCEPTPTCTCILQAVPCADQCVADGGALSATCVVIQKGPPAK